MPDPYEPLWADSLADQPRPDVVARVVEEIPDGDPPARERPPVTGGRPFALGLAATAAVLVVALGESTHGSLSFGTVPSHWGDTPMVCKTLRFERDDRAVEWFGCRAVGGDTLPPGLYQSPDSQWRSDISRREASASSIRISPDGSLVGWARYP